jgi:hypothetical protein
MKRLVFLFIVFVVSCNTNTTQPGATVKESVKDSLIKQVQQKDSSIMAYIGSINTIQKGIDTLMIDERVLKVNSGEKINDTGTLISELRTIGTLILKNRRALNELQHKLKISNEQNQGLTDLGEELSKQLNERDSEIAIIQHELGKTKESLATVVKQFNDSMTTIQQQRNQISVLQLKGNTIYYVTGTEKGLKDAGIIIENGGAIGLGKVPAIGPDANNSSFYSADLTTLKEIELNGRFSKMVTPHPTGSYRIMSGATDKLIITDQEDFWSKSRYMVLLVK